MAWNAKPCVVDGRRYESIFAAAIDFELDYSWLFLKLKKSGGKTVSVCGHEISLLQENVNKKKLSNKE